MHAYTQTHAQRGKSVKKPLESEDDLESTVLANTLVKQPAVGLWHGARSHCCNLRQRGQ